MTRGSEVDWHVVRPTFGPNPADHCVLLPPLALDRFVATNRSVRSRSDCILAVEGFLDQVARRGTAAA